MSPLTLRIAILIVAAALRIRFHLMTKTAVDEACELWAEVERRF